MIVKKHAILVCADEDSEPLQKKLRLSPDVQDESDEPQFSVVTLPSETHTPCFNTSSDVEAVNGPMCLNSNKHEAFLPLASG